MSTNAKELAEELQARREANIWDLRPCPCCGAKAHIHTRKHSVQILCSQMGCRDVEGPTLADAAFLWNLPRFSDKA